MVEQMRISNFNYSSICYNRTWQCRSSSRLYMASI